jgi:uncharacterized membrane protein
MKKLISISIKTPTANLYALVLGLALAGCGAEALAATTYTMTDLSAAGPGYFPSSFAPNGQILMHSYVYPGYTPRLYNPATGRLNAIPALLGGGPYSDPVIINAKGQVAVVSGIFPKLYNPDGTIIDFNTLPHSLLNFPYDHPPTALSDSGILGVDAFIGSVKLGGMHKLARLWPCNDIPGDPTCEMFNPFVYDINAHGQAVGTSALLRPSPLLGVNSHAFIGTPSGLKDLTLSSGIPNITTRFGGNNDIAYAVNDKGFAVGQYTIGRTDPYPHHSSGDVLTHPVVWDTKNNKYTDLASPNSLGSLLDINASGQIVGAESSDNVISGLPNPTHGVIGHVNSRGLIDLTTLVKNLPAGWVISGANKISDDGRILAGAVGQSGLDGRWVLLTPSTQSPPPIPASAPLVPTNLTVVTASRSLIALHWIDTATNEKNYLIERCIGASCTNFSQIAQVGANVTTYANTGLSRNTSYRYRIRAVNTYGKSAYSNTLTAKTLR